MRAKRRALVLGGGLAGMSAALRLADGGRHDVTLLCMEHRLGGKAASWRTPDGDLMETGFHSLFGYYTAVPALLKRCGRDVRDPRWFTSNRGVHRLWDPPSRALNTLRIPDGPLDLDALRQSDLLGWRGMTALQKLRTARWLPQFAWEIWRREPDPALDEIGFAAWAVAHGLHVDLTRTPWFRYIFDLTYNYPNEGSAYVGVKGFRDLLGYRNAEVLYFNGGMSEVLIAPVAEALVRAGVRVEFCTKVTGITLDPVARAITRVCTRRMAEAVPIDGVHDHVRPRAIGRGYALDDAPYPVGDPAPGDDATRELAVGRDFDDVVWTIPIDGTRRLLRTTPDHPRAVLAHDDLANLLRLRTVVSITLRAWLPARVTPSDLDTVVLCTPQPAATIIDYANRIDAMRHGGSVIELLGQEGFDGHFTDAELAGRLLRDLAAMPFVDPKALDVDALLAGRRGRYTLRRNTAEHMRYVLMEPGHWKHRPDTAARGYDNLVFAGDWVKGTQPTASTEAAVRTGDAAAQALLAR